MKRTITEESLQEAVQTNAPPREPTEAMDMAGYRVLQHYAEADCRPTAKQVWRAMYDAWVEEQE